MWDGFMLFEDEVTTFAPRQLLKFIYQICCQYLNIKIQAPVKNVQKKHIADGHYVTQNTAQNKIS